MKKNRFYFCLFIVETILLISTSCKSILSRKEPLLILISFDGFRWDYLENHTLPNIQKYFVQNGVKISNGLRNAFTTVTYPNHWTLATGLYPESHGMVANAMYDSILNETFYDLTSNENSTRWFGQNKQAIPIWILNQLKNGRKSGVVGGFPGSIAPILNTTIAYSIDYQDKLDWFEKIDHLLDLFTNENINLGVLYFDDPDETSHQFGPYSENLKSVLFKCDSIMGYLIERLIQVGLYERMNIILTSDHGMDTAEFDKSIDLSDFTDITKFKYYGGLTQINIFPNDPNDLEEIYESLKNIPHYNVFKKEEVPERYNYRNNVRIGPIVMFGDVGYETFATGRKKFNWDSWKGDHGGDNLVASMHPVFVARGPAFKQNYQTNKKKIINSVDLYPLMCFILDLEPAMNNGSLENIRELLINYNNSDFDEQDFFPIKNYFHGLFDKSHSQTHSKKISEKKQFYFINFLLIFVFIILFLLFFFNFANQK